METLLSKGEQEFFVNGLKTIIVVDKMFKIGFENLAMLS